MSDDKQEMLEKIADAMWRYVESGRPVILVFGAGAVEGLIRHLPVTPDSVIVHCTASPEDRLLTTMDMWHFHDHPLPDFDYPSLTPQDIASLKTGRDVYVPLDIERRMRETVHAASTLRIDPVQLRENHDAIRIERKLMQSFNKARPHVTRRCGQPQRAKTPHIFKRR